MRGLFALTLLITMVFSAPISLSTRDSVNLVPRASVHLSARHPTGEEDEAGTGLGVKKSKVQDVHNYHAKDVSPISVLYILHYLLTRVAHI
jgi:hypothetical protein